MTAYKVYAGIGSRTTPADMLALMRAYAKRLGAAGWTLRSGAEGGADTAFEDGACSYPTEIWLPWIGFNEHTSRLKPSKAAFDLAAKHHPAWNNCTRGARAVHARSCHLVLGEDLKTPVAFVFCWTRDGKGGVGPNQTIRVAQAHDIPVFDLGVRGVQEQVESLLARIAPSHFHKPCEQRGIW